MAADIQCYQYPAMIQQLESRHFKSAIKLLGQDKSRRWIEIFINPDNRYWAEFVVNLDDSMACMAYNGSKFYFGGEEYPQTIGDPRQ